ncbi:MAG TPA: LysR substrate-binding domain-containing protein [Burkholderiales bacterium]|jgi:LysR family cyn operon transcriptional activator|nr:LysR substrate-binding domain-containing protein [Burkholderiales bacterium]HEV8647247.1 LysR substrate-binding domain-containing protein [Burkholderiales bacterium]
MDEAIEIRHLRYFLAVAATENFTRAAERMRISQPSVSQQVAQLERILHTLLFRRIGKRVQLTEAGMTFRRGAEVVLRKLEEACGSVNDIAALVSGHVDLGVIPALHVAWVPPLLERMARDYPGTTVGVQELASSGIETELEAGRLDLGFGLITRSSPNVRYEHLLSAPFSLIVSEQHKLADHKLIDPGSLDGERLVLLPHRFDMRREGDKYFRNLRMHPKVAFEIDSIDALLTSVARAGTPTILPAIVLRGREALRLRAIPLARNLRSIDFGLLWPSGSTVSPAALAVGAILKDLLPGFGRVPRSSTVKRSSRRRGKTPTRRYSGTDGTYMNEPSARSLPRGQRGRARAD